MASYGTKLLDREDNVIFPCTRSNFVYMSDDTTLEDKVTDMTKTINDLRDGVELVHGFKQYFKNGQLGSSFPSEVEFTATVSAPGLFIVSISNTTVKSNEIECGSSYSIIRLNGNVVAQSSCPCFNTTSDTQDFGSSASACLIVQPRDTVVLTIRNTGHHAEYNITAIYTGEMAITEPSDIPIIEAGGNGAVTDTVGR